MPNPIVEDLIRPQSARPQMRPQQQQSQNNMSMETIKKLYKIVSNSNNPSAMLETVLSQNPQIQQIAKMISNNGLNYQQVFLQLANKYGVDPNQILQDLQS